MTEVITNKEYDDIANLLQEGKDKEARIQAKKIQDETVRTISQVLIERSRRFPSSETQ